MSTATLVGAGGLALIATNAYTGPQRDALSPVWTGSGDLTDAHTTAKRIGAEALAVGGLVLLSGQSPAAARGSLAVLGCLWLLWLVRHGHHRNTGGGVSGPPSALHGGPKPGAGPLLPPPSGHGPTITTLPRNTIPGLP